MFMPYPVKDLLEIYEDVEGILLFLQIFLAEDPEIDIFLCDAPSRSEKAYSAAMISSDFSERKGAPTCFY